MSSRGSISTWPILVIVAAINSIAAQQPAAVVARNQVTYRQGLTPRTTDSAEQLSGVAAVRSTRRSGAFGQRLPQSLRGSSHLRHVCLVLGIRSVEIGSAERAILPFVNAHEAPATAAQAQRNRDAAAFSH